jgi:hypothetical protein
MGKWHPVGGPLSFRGIAHAMNPESISLPVQVV